MYLANESMSHEACGRLNAFQQRNRSSMPHLFYTHGLGGSRSAQPEIEEVFAPLGYKIVRVEVPYHDNVATLALKLATMTFGELCLLIHETANNIIERAKSFSPDEYAVIGDSLGGFISTVWSLWRTTKAAIIPLGKRHLSSTQFLFCRISY